MITVRKLSSDRWKEYRALRLEALRSEPAAFSSSYEREAHLPEDEWKTRLNNCLFAMSSDDKPVGMIACVFETEPKTRHVANIFAVYVKRDYRGQGIGARLMEAALVLISLNAEILKVKLTVTHEQSVAVRMYEHFGFKIVGRLSKELCVAGQFYDDLLMERLL